MWPSLSIGQLGGTMNQELPDRERTCRMVALTRDFHVFAACITARISAVLLSIGNIAKTWNMRTFFRRLIRHK
jgi:hypothetical protein